MSKFQLEAKCPNCDRLLNAAVVSDMPIGAVPKAGDVTLCFYCGTWNEFTGDPKVLVKASPEVVAGLSPEAKRRAEVVVHVLETLKKMGLKGLKPGKVDMVPMDDIIDLSDEITAFIRARSEASGGLIKYGPLVTLLAFRVIRHSLLNGHLSSKMGPDSKDVVEECERMVEQSLDVAQQIFNEAKEAKKEELH